MAIKPRPRDVWHELRTPLAGIRSVLELLSAVQVSEDEARDLLKRALNEVDRLEDLIERLRAEVGTRQIDPDAGC